MAKSDGGNGSRLDDLVEIGRSFEQTYRPVLELDGWKVAMLRHFEGVDRRGFHRVERHRNTAEVFVLTAGNADLIVFDGAAAPTRPFTFPMEPHVAYKVARGVWHHVTMSEDAHIVLFERAETSPATTDFFDLPTDTIQKVSSRFRQTSHETT